MKTKDLVLVSILSSLIVGLEYLLSFLPNIQTTFLLLLVSFSVLSLKDSILLLIVYCLLDHLFYGLSPYLLASFFGLMPLLLVKSLKSLFSILMLGIISAINYALCYALLTILMMKVDPLVYLASDLPFTLILISSTAITILFLFEPLKKGFEKIIKRY